MTVKNGDMPAMPLSGDAYQDFAGYDGTSKTGYNPECQGLTKREQFAAMAMQSLIQVEPIYEQMGYVTPSDKGMAITAIAKADALLAALEGE